jgi:hypothetical protein
MDVLRFVVGGILPYVAVAVFLVAMTHRVLTWRAMPSPPMTLFPAPPPSQGANRVNTMKEALFF